ncbi:MAG: DNA-binding protein [Castellaniella sp.]|nr:DNA-binding protein [Castellaniella sp.]
MKLIDVKRKKPSMEHAFRAALTDNELSSEICKRVGWDSTQVSRFLSGQMGLTIGKLDSAIEALGMVVASREYMDFLAYGAKVGASCECARSGAGECGR